VQVSPDTPNRPRALSVFGAAATGLFMLLLVRNRTLLSVVVNESGDSAANSIIVGQAKHFRLLVGNYSRIGFSHPGPAFFYVQAFGEWLGHDVLHLVPTPWNGQALAVLALNSTLVAAALTVIAGWARSWVPVGLVAAVLFGYLAVHGELVAEVWLPLMYFPPFLLLLVAAASVAAGRVGDLPLLALAGGFLVHGHAEFLLFVPVIAGAGLAAAWWRLRGALVRQHRRAWLVTLGVAALFALPVAVNLVLHWPGEFARYAGYGGSSRAGGHPPLAALGYALRFWPGGGVTGALAAVVLFAGVLLLARVRRSPLLWTGAAVAGLAAALVIGYAARGIDDLSQDYVGFFSRAVPVTLMALLALAVGNLVEPGRVAVAAAATMAAATMAAATFAALALSPTPVTRRETIDNLPAVVGALARATGGRPVLLDTDHDAWPEMDALIVAGHRTGLRICARDPSWRFMVTGEFVCTARDIQTGHAYRLSLDGSGGTVVGRAVLATEPGV
jgi:hypothetical protein